MLLALGPTTVDVAERGLVVAVLPRESQEALTAVAERAAADGADLVDVAGPVVDLGVPVALRVADVEQAGAANAAGAVAVVPVPAPDGGDAVVGVLREAAGRLLGAGLDRHRLVLEPVTPGGRQVVLPGARELRCVGVPVLVSVVRPGPLAGPDPAVVSGPLAAAVVRGCGLVRVAAPDVRSARRVVDVIAAVRRGRP